MSEEKPVFDPIMIVDEDHVGILMTKDQAAKIVAMLGQLISEDYQATFGKNYSELKQKLGEDDYDFKTLKINRRLYEVNRFA